MVVYRWREAIEPVAVEAAFQPLPDITAHELALIMLNTAHGAGLQRVSFTREEWDALDDSIKRHFVRLDE